jgi:ABC-type sugar transport system permease subunit
VGSTSIFVYYIYEVAFEYFKIGKASAAVLIFFVIIIGITLMQFYGLRKRIHYER